MFTIDQLDTVTDTTLSATRQVLFSPVLRDSDEYKSNPGRYATLETELATLDGSTPKKIVQAKLLILAYDYLCEEINFGTEALEPTVKSSINFSNVRDLQQVCRFVLFTLFDPNKGASPLTSGVAARISNATLFGTTGGCRSGLLYDDASDFCC